jgi:tRNA dimethylallyltransferase
MPYDLLVILGPTASGKTRLAVELARRLSAEIISADSRQVYRGMDIGTGKDLAEYGTTPYHLIDIAEPGSEFNVFEFQRRFLQAFADIRSRSILPVLVGGTGMYLDAVLKGYRLVHVPENAALRRELAPLSGEALAARLKNSHTRLHNTTDLLDRDRLTRAIEIAEYEQSHQAEPLPEISPLTFGIRWERSVLRRRITERLRARLEQGLIEEVERLHQAGIPYETLEFYGLEYRFVAQHLKGELSSNDMFQKLNSAIHDFAKRQDTWFRRMERHGTLIHWLAGDGDPLAEALLILQGDAEKQPQLSTTPLVVASTHGKMR